MMGEYEPDDSRDVTLGKSHNPVEPERTGRREDQARDKAARRKSTSEEGTIKPVKGQPRA